MRRLTLSFALGVTLPLLLALYVGGENVAQLGLRMSAIEQGFALASRHWQFEATPEHEMMAQSEPEPAAVRTKGTGKPRR